jgi:hypothetical protein
MARRRVLGGSEAPASGGGRRRLLQHWGTKEGMRCGPIRRKIG